MLNAGNRIVNNWIYPIKDGYVVIDTGYENGFKKFKKNISKLHIKLDDIRYVFLTHAHDDHAGFLNQFLSETTDARIIMSDKSPEVLYRGQNSFLGGCTSRMALLFCQLMKLFGKGSHRFPPMEHCYEKRCFFVSNANRKEIEMKLGGRIIDTPGHTADSISLLLDDGALFCGDAAMNGFPSIHKITIWAEDKAAFAETWKTIIDVKPKMIYPGHGNPFQYNELRSNLPYVQKMKLFPLT